MLLLWRIIQLGKLILGGVMKRYTYVALIALLVQCGLSNVVYAMNVDTSDDSSLVRDIKHYSDLSDVDEKQYKLLRLGDLGTAGAFLAGVVSAIGVGVGTYKTAGVVQSVTPDSVPTWMTNPVVLAGLGSLGAGYTSYTTLYPRIRAGVIYKVQRFMDLCETLNQDSPSRRNTILNWNFVTFSELKRYLPQSWSSASNKAVYNALFNLLNQAIVAKKLLQQVGIDVETQAMYNTLTAYIQVLGNNKDLYASMVAFEDQRQRQEEHAVINYEYQKKLKGAEIADLEARADLQQQGARLAQVTAAQRYLQMTTDTIKNVWDGLNYLYKNKEKIVYRGTILSGAMYGAYLAAKAKLGYGQ